MPIFKNVTTSFLNELIPGKMKLATWKRHYGGAPAASNPMIA
jgi:hypothetical protein